MHHVNCEMLEGLQCVGIRLRQDHGREWEPEDRTDDEGMDPALARMVCAIDFFDAVFVYCVHICHGRPWLHEGKAVPRPSDEHENDDAEGDRERMMCDESPER